MRSHWRYARYLARHKWYVLQAGLLLWPLHGVRDTLRWLRWCWRLVIHDASKFTPSEWRPYAAHFYGPTQSQWEAREFRHWMPVLGYVSEWAQERARLSWTVEVRNRQDRFDLAWLYHQKRNRHHWQFYLLVPDQPDKNGNRFVLELTPSGYVLTERGVGAAGAETDSQSGRVLANVVAAANRSRALPMQHEDAVEMVADWCGAGRAVTGRWEALDWYAEHRYDIILHPATRVTVEQLLDDMRKRGYA